MRVRLASIAFLIGSAVTGLAWLTVQPTWAHLIALVRRRSEAGSPELVLLGRLQALLPMWIGLDLLGSAVLCYVLLELTVGRPLARAEAAIDDLAHLERSDAMGRSGGPLLSRLEGALRRTAHVLLEDRGVIQRQVSELTATNAALARAQTELVAAEQRAMVGKLAAGVAHEVGNPLSGILGYLSIARARSSSPEVVDLLSRMEVEVQRINQIVRGLLDLGRPMTGAPGPVVLAPVVESTARLAFAGSELSGVALRLDVDPDLVVRAEAGPLSQVLLNLLINAAQASRGEGAIRVRAWAEGGRALLEVLDDGPGLAPEIAARLFEPFNTSKPAGKGSGLGLAVSQHLVRSMGGELTGDNAPEGGARFRVLLPLA